MMKMNRGHGLEMTSSPIQQILANPSLWNNINTMRAAPQLTPLPNTSLPQKHPMHQTSYYHEPSLNLYPSLCLPSFVPTWRGDINWEKDEGELTYDQSLTQLLLYGLAGSDRDQKDNNINNNAILDGKPRLFENWCLHQQYQQAPSPKASSSITDTIKEETVINSPPSDNYPNCLFGHHANDDFKVENSAAFRSTNNSCNKSCVTSLRENSHPDPVPDRKSTNNSKRLGRDRFSEFEGRVSGGNTQKKAKNHSNSRNQDNFKVIKEKLGDRITTLHQLVSPFGKTDTASVLLEAIGYIRFLQSQIEALSSPYFGGSAGTKHQKTEFHGESKIDLRSRGLCLVPISCTIRVGNDGIDGDDFWTPAKRSPPGLFR